MSKITGKEINVFPLCVCIIKKNVSHLTYFLKRGLNLEKVMFSHSEGNVGREDTKRK